MRPNIRSYGIKIYGIRSKTAYFGPKDRIYDRIFTVCRMVESAWCNYGYKLVLGMRKLALGALMRWETQ